MNTHSVVLLVAALLVQGCSLVTVRKPPSTAVDRCTTAYTAPIVDTVLTASLVGGLVDGADGRASNGDEVATGTLVVVGAVAILAASSTIYGYEGVAACRAEQEAIENSRVRTSERTRAGLK